MRLFTKLAAGVVVAAVVVGCAGATHNAADVTFAQQMIPHHGQAVEMAGLAPQRASSPQVAEVAARIAAAQDPEITQMKDLLSQWGNATHGGHGSGGHAGGQLPGMIADDQLERLRSMSGPEFDRLFLQQMTEHHVGAVLMAQAELRDGQSVDARSLAQKIVGGQQGEIARMRTLLG